MSASHVPSSSIPPEESEQVCSICCKKEQCRPIEGLRPPIIEELKDKGLDLNGKNVTICTACLSAAMNQHALAVMKANGRGSAEMEKELAERATEIADEIEHGIPSTIGHRAADAVARVGGSWGFVLSFIGMLIFWPILNTVILAGGFDPFPYILLNLVLSCIASIQAPIILMSQSRMAEIDRIRATEDFRTNLKAQLEVSLLHEKIDSLLEQQEKRDQELKILQQLLVQQSSPERPRQAS